MKKLNSLLFSIFMIAVSILPLQNVFAVDVPLKPGIPGPGDVPQGGYALKTTSLKTTSLKTTFIIPVTASLNGTELALYFGSPVGVAQITIEDQYGAIVYQDAINTNSTSELLIATDGWASGNYTVNIAYGTSSLSGTFLLY